MQEVTAIDLVNFCKEGKQPVVQFISAIDESVIDVNMKGRIILAEVDSTDPTFVIIKLTINVKDFEEQNKPFMIANYYDKNRNPTLTYIEAGVCKSGIENVFVMPEDKFKLVETNNLFDRFLKEKKENQTYVEFLEEKVLLLESKSKLQELLRE